VVLPGRWPTMETIVRAHAEGNIAPAPSLVGGFGYVAVAEPNIAEFHFARGFTIACALRFVSMVIGSSSSLKMRSETAIADCKMLNFSLKS